VSINGRAWVAIPATQEIAQFIAPYAKLNDWIVRASDGWIEISGLWRFFGYSGDQNGINWERARFEIGQIRALFPEYEIRYGHELCEGPHEAVIVTDSWACEPDPKLARARYDTERMARR
jgi:hypothetical protein